MNAGRRLRPFLPALSTKEAFNCVFYHRKAYVTSNSKMDFLADKVASVADFTEEDNIPVKKQKCVHACCVLLTADISSANLC